MDEPGIEGFPRRKDRLKGNPLPSIAGLAVFLALGVALGPLIYRLLSQREAVQAWIGRFGSWGPLVSVFLNVLQVLLAPVPGQALGFANGYLFGVTKGTLYGWIGVQVGSALAMGMARLWGRPLVLRWMEMALGQERARMLLGRWDRLAQAHGPLFFLLVFLFPFLPDDLACFLIGLSPLPLGPMWLLAGIGRLPGLVVASWVGANAGRPPAWLWSVLLAGGGLLGWGYARYRERIEAALLQTLIRIERQAAAVSRRRWIPGRRSDRRGPR